MLNFANYDVQFPFFLIEEMKFDNINQEAEKERVVELQEEEHDQDINILHPNRSPLSLSDVPHQSLLRIMRRMNAKTLCRLRQTCRAMDNFAEENRFILNRRKTDSPWLFRISEEDGEWQFYISNMEINESEVELENPEEQLSAVPIAELHINDNDSESDEADIDKFLVFLGSLRLDVTSLISLCGYIPKVLPLVKYQKLQHHDDESFPRLSTWNVNDLKSCRELTWDSDDHCRLTADEVIPLLSHLEVLSVDFIDESPDADPDDPTLWLTFLEKVFLTVTQSETKLPLKMVKISRPSDLQMPLSLNPTTLMICSPYRVDSVGDCLVVHTLSFKHGTLIFVEQCEYPYCLDVIFVENYSRSSLFNDVWGYFCFETHPPIIIEKFMNAATDSQALLYLREATAPLLRHDREKFPKQLF